MSHGYKKGKQCRLQKEEKSEADGQHRNPGHIPMEEAVATFSGSVGFFDLYLVALGMTLELFGYNSNENWNVDSGSSHSADKNTIMCH